MLRTVDRPACQRACTYFARHCIGHIRQRATPHDRVVQARCARRLRRRCHASYAVACLHTTTTTTLEIDRIDRWIGDWQFVGQLLPEGRTPTCPDVPATIIEIVRLAPPDATLLQPETAFFVFLTGTIQMNPCDQGGVSPFEGSFGCSGFTYNSFVGATAKLTGPDAATFGVGFVRYLGGNVECSAHWGGPMIRVAQ